MLSIAISEFRAHMSKYLRVVMEGKSVVLTSHGKAVAEINQPTNRKEMAANQLSQIAATAEVGDILSPVMDEFGEAE